MEWLKRKFLLDNAEGIKKPTDANHIKTLRFHLNILNCWPGKELGEKVSKYRILISFAYICLSISILIGSYLYISTRTLTFYEQGHIYITQLMCAVNLSRVFLISLSKKCKHVFTTFVTTIYLLYYKEKSDYALQTYKQVHKISHFFTVILTTQAFSGLWFFTMIPVYRNYAKGLFKEKVLQNASYEHSIYFAFPLDIHTSFNAYVFSIPLNLYLAYYSTSWFIIVDLLLASMVFHLWGHLKILIYDLGSFPLPAKKIALSFGNKSDSVNVKMYSEKESENIAQKLKQCINYHRLIVDFTGEVTETFGPGLFIYYAFHQACGCLLLLECSQMTLDTLVCYGQLTIVAYQLLIQMSVIFELIGSTSEKLKDAVYSLPWEYMDTSNRKTVLILLIRVQKPIQVKALGLAHVGVTTMATILKTSFTYFMFLRTIDNK